MSNVTTHILFLAILCTAGSTLVATEPTPTWRIAEINLEASREHASPFTEVTVTAEFRCGETVVNRPAFWNGGKVWKVRFAPTKPGAWTWTTTCSDPSDPGLHARQGTVQAVAYDGPHAIFRHGFLRVSDNRRHFAYRDGTPFFWLGDTHWQAPDWERVDSNNAPDAKPGVGQFQQLVADRVAKGFTVYQTYMQGSNRHWWSDEARTIINPARFAVMDTMLDHLADQGQVTALGIGLYRTSIALPRTSLVKLATYVAARYGAHPLVWITAQEVNLPNDGKTKEKRTDLEVWKAAAMAFDRAEGYGIPVSGHMFVGKPTIWGDQPWHDWFALQGGHTSEGPRKTADARFYWDFKPTKPFIETEAMYEGVICGPRPATAADARIVAWKNTLNGSCGFTYGAAAVWLLKWDKDDKRGEAYNPKTWWYEGMRLPGSTHMTHYKTFFTSLSWWRLEPRFADKSWCDFIDPEATVLASDGQDIFVIYAYTYSHSNKKRDGMDLRLGRLGRLDAAKTYAATWFDPRTGDRKPIPAVVPVNGWWDLPARPDAQDWALLVRVVPAAGPAAP